MIMKKCKCCWSIVIDLNIRNIKPYLWKIKEFIYTEIIFISAHKKRGVYIYIHFIPFYKLRFGMKKWKLPFIDIDPRI